MTAKHYARIALIIASSCNDPRENLVAMKIGIDLSQFFAEDNPAFDKERFGYAARISLEKGKE